VKQSPKHLFLKSLVRGTNEQKEFDSFTKVKSVRILQNPQHLIMQHITILKSFFFQVMLSVFACVCTYAQNIPDSITQKLKAAVSDSARVIILLDEGDAIISDAPAVSFTYYQQALALGKKMNNKRCIAMSLGSVGIAYIEMNKFDSAIHIFQQSVPFYRELKDTSKEASVLANIGNVYLHKKDNAAAIEYYLQSARLLETASDQKWLATLYSNISALLNDQKEYTRAVEFGNKAVAIARKLGNRISEVNALINLSSSYSQLGDVDKEYALLQEALPIAKGNGDDMPVGTIYNSLGDYHRKIEKYPVALTNYLEGYRYMQKLGNKYYLIPSTIRLARTYFKMNENEKALQYIKEAEKIAGEVGERAELHEIYEVRAGIEQKAGNYKLAADYFSKTLILTDSIFTAEASEKVAEVEARYQNEKKQQEILQLEKDKKIQSLIIKQKSTFNYILLGSVAALLLTFFLGYRNFKHGQKLKQQRITELENEKLLLATQSIVKGQEEERSRLAKDLHDGLGGLLSGVKLQLGAMKGNLILSEEHGRTFNNALGKLDESINEMRRVAHNMMPEALMKLGLQQALQDYCDGLSALQPFKINCEFHALEKRMPASTEIVVYRIVQELLNNAVKHSGATNILAQVIRQDNSLSITIEDNGKGFDISNAGFKRGAGLSNIQSRVDYLKGHMDIESTSAKGTSIHIDCNIESNG
jgi:two-component system, NarL family, sensor kinase